MRLSKLYSNRPELFGAIDFLPGLNVVMAEIRLPENRDKDTHNLGKTTLGRLLDFCFLSKRDPNFFLFKHFNRFEAFVFFLEIELLDGSFITVRRTVLEASKASFKRHAKGHQDFSALVDSAWDHFEVPFERAQNLLDGALDWRGLSPWSFRKGLAYQLRSQDDFGDVFHLSRYAAHADWKPFLAHTLGFNSTLVKEHYETEEELEHLEQTARTINSELGGSIGDISKIEGFLLLKQQDASKKERLLDAFDFRAEDKARTKRVVDDLDEEIAALNEERYSLAQVKKKLQGTLDDDQILFDPEEARRIFEQAGVYFGGQIKRDFEQLIAFNRTITDERRTYLQEERAEVDARLKEIGARLNLLGKQRSENLAFLSGTDSFNKYKALSEELVVLKAEITSLERQRGFIHRLQAIRSEIRTKEQHRTDLQAQIEADVETQNADRNSLFSSIRLFFSDIVETVLGHKALLNVSPNNLGHLDFQATILDQAGNATSADLGHTYRKLLCIAFDLAVLRAHLDVGFPRFAFHDGALEALDNRKKENLLEVLEQYSGLGIQIIITLIDSDLPSRPKDQLPVFAAETIVLLLHDEGADGRLFKMNTW